MTIIKNEAESTAKHTSCDCESKFSSTYVILIKSGVIKCVNVNVKIIASAKKIIVEILAHVFVRMVSIEKSLVMIQKLINKSSQ